MAVWAVLLIPAAYFTVKHVKENKMIDAYLAQNGLFDSAIDAKTATQVSDLIRDEFNVDEKSFRKLNMFKRPFLREDVSFLLTHKEGLCGEGTRVIVSLLNQLGFDATRITLYDNKLIPVHTLVSILIDGREILVDSINSPGNLNSFLRTNMITSNDFKLLHYSGSTTARRKFMNIAKIENEYLSDEHREFFDKYWLYSFEATPYSKLFNRIGIDIRVFNLERPNRWISHLAERPNLVTAIVFFFLSLIAVFFLHITKIIKKSCRFFVP